MPNTNGSTQNGRFTASRSSARRRSAGAGTQILVSCLLLADLFLLYTIAMQMTHTQKAFEASATVNLALLVVFALGAVGLGYALWRTGAWKRCLCILLIAATLWLICVYSNIPFIKKYREMWIETAMATMRHQGLATFYIPAPMVEEVTGRVEEGRNSQAGVNTPLDIFEGDASDNSWIMAPPEGDSKLILRDEGFEELPDDQKLFYGMFYELDRESAEAYFAANPDVLANGYEHVMINETALGGEGTSIRTKLGEKVLAIDTENEVLILEVDADGSRGVMAICKDASRLHLYPAAHIGSYGENAGSIAQRNGGILAMTGSGFIDEGGVGNGGEIAGYAMCDGASYGNHYGWGYKRMELHENNWFYLQDAYTDTTGGTTDAMEFTPGLLINGTKLDPGIWTGLNPRACIGQSTRGEILMLTVEGRTLASPGCSVEICADILLQHDGINAINCDGGTTAIMWYRGQPIMRCSNAAIPEGRHLPNAWVYVGD